MLPPSTRRCPPVRGGPCPSEGAVGRLTCPLNSASGTVLEEVLNEIRVLWDSTAPSLSPFFLSRCEYFTKVVRMNHKRRVMSDRANATSTYGSLSVLSRGSQTVRSATDARNQLTLCLSGVRLWTMWAWMFLARCRDSTQSPCPHACCAHRHAMATTERGSLAAAAAGGSACVICGDVTQVCGPMWRDAGRGRWLPSR